MLSMFSHFQLHLCCYNMNTVQKLAGGRPIECLQAKPWILIMALIIIITSIKQLGLLRTNPAVE